MAPRGSSGAVNALTRVTATCVELVVQPRKTDAEVSEPALAWRSFAVDRAGLARPLG